MKLESTAEVLEFDPFNSESAEAMNIGELIRLADHRAFRYALAGASNISKGKAQTAPAQKTNHHNMAVQAAAAIGATSVSVTLGATATAASEYTEGYLTISVTPGQGTIYKIENQPATSSAGTQTVTLFDPINVALTTSSKANLVHNTFANTIEGTTQTRRAAGTPMITVTASNYYWAQTHGIASVLADQAITLGSAITFSGSVSGAVIANSTTYSTAVLTTPIGQADIMAGVDTEYRPIILNIID